jgi:hypothetical protein
MYHLLVAAIVRMSVPSEFLKFRLAQTHDLKWRQDLHRVLLLLLLLYIYIYFFFFFFFFFPPDSRNMSSRISRNCSASVMSAFSAV